MKIKEIYYTKMVRLSLYCLYASSLSLLLTWLQ